jgi:regulator of protease activity HflC (stomatin/prohibitin superfamily)
MVWLFLALLTFAVSIYLFVYARRIAKDYRQEVTDYEQLKEQHNEALRQRRADAGSSYNPSYPPEAPLRPAKRLLMSWYSLAPAAALLGLFFLYTACSMIVELRHYGVVTVFNRETNQNLGSGHHWKAPWEEIAEVDGTVQNDEYVKDGAIEVRLANNATAWVPVKVTWRVAQEGASTVRKDYKSDVNEVRTALVKRNLESALMNVFDTYDPLATIDDSDADTPTSKFDADLKKTLQKQLGTVVQVDAVTVLVPKYDATTESSISDLQAESNRTRIAGQKQQTATAEAAANATLDASLTPEVLADKCLNMVSTMIEKNQSNLPAGFSCPGSSGSAVIVPSAPSPSAKSE